MSEQASPPRVDLPDLNEYPSFLVVDGKVFSLSQMNCNYSQSVDALQDFYKQRFEHFRNEQERVTSDVILGQGFEHVEHLARVRARGSIAVPENLFERDIKVVNGRIVETRHVLYTPEEYRVDRNYLEYYGIIARAGNNPTERQVAVKALLDPYLQQGGTLNILLKYPYASIVQFMFDRETGNITADSRTFHVMSSHNLCTAGIEGRIVWDVSDARFASYINRVNLFSLAQSEIEILDVKTRQMVRFHIRDLFTVSNIISVSVEGRSAWSV